MKYLSRKSGFLDSGHSGGYQQGKQNCSYIGSNTSGRKETKMFHQSLVFPKDKMWFHKSLRAKSEGKKIILLLEFSIVVRASSISFINNPFCSLKEFGNPAIGKCAYAF